MPCRHAAEAQAAELQAALAALHGQAAELLERATEVDALREAALAAQQECQVGAVGAVCVGKRQPHAACMHACGSSVHIVLPLSH